MNTSTSISAAAVAAQPALGQTVRHPSFLCVDDHELVRDGICAVLLGKGWHCKSASGGGGDEALHSLAPGLESVDVLITDHNMPGMSGLELVRKLRATNFTGKIVVHSTMLLSIERAAYQDLNVDAIVPKTGCPECLLKAIEELRQD